MRGMFDADPQLGELVDAAVLDPTLARKLVEADPTLLDRRNSLGETALHFLAVENYGGGVQTLIDLGASVHVTNQFGATPLEEAMSIDAADAVAVLIRAGAAPPNPAPEPGG